jgi:hypothetical protein
MLLRLAQCVLKGWCNGTPVAITCSSSRDKLFIYPWLSAGSRHIYTKGFKKTIYMQIIQVMHGIQMCVSSVKVRTSLFA